MVSDEVISVAEARFEKWRNTIGFFLGPLLFFALLLWPISGVSPEAAKLTAVLGLTIIWWICEPIPIPITALLAPTLCVLLGIADAKSLFASFGNPIVFVFVGGFILAEAMMVHGLDRRIALTFLGNKLVGNSVMKILFGFGFITAFLSMWLSNTATTAMLVPIAIGIIAEVREGVSRQTGQPVSGKSLRIGTALMLMLAYSASIGGLGTPIGTPPNLIGIGMIEKTIGKNISFFQWMLFAVPILVVMYIVLYFVIVILHKPEVKVLNGFQSYIHERKRDLGRMTRGEKNTLIAFGLAVVLWVLPGILSLFPFGPVEQFTDRYSKVLPEGMIALLGASTLFVLPVNWKHREFTLTWDKASKIDWGTILLFGGGIALGDLTFSTGLAKALGEGILLSTNISGEAMIILLAVALGILVSETASNTASATMVIPVVISVSQGAGVDPLGPALGACLGASYGFMLPVSTPPNAIVYGTGMVPITKMIKTGIVFDIIGMLVIWGGVLLLKGLFV